MYDLLEKLVCVMFWFMFIFGIVVVFYCVLLFLLDGVGFVFFVWWDCGFGMSFFMMIGFGCMKIGDELIVVDWIVKLFDFIFVVWFLILL